MKLLFDQNISFRIVKKISEIFPDSAQVRQLDLEDKTDYNIWEYARRNGYSIVTFDADFYDLSLIKGTPPKIIWLRTGNTNTSEIAQLLLENSDLIIEFISAKAYQDLSCLEIK